MKPTLYDLVRKKKNIRLAWKKVYKSGIRSLSPETQNEIIEFKQDSPTHIERICRQLCEKRFRFSPAEGKPIKRPGKSARPLVKAPIESRIVQRSILNVLQCQPTIKQYLDTPYSFGGIKEKSVSTAVIKAYNFIKDGYTHFVKSDISGFFNDIPRPKVIKIIASGIKDKEFITFIDQASTTELANLSALKKEHADLFPTHELGVAQGCSLSPLMGNILLYDFDKEMNNGGIVCLRYIDDFIILAKSEKKVKKAFQKAKRLLETHSLKTYDPFKRSDKAGTGQTSKSFEFLGCEILPGLIRPSKKSRKNLLASVKSIVKKNTSYLTNPRKAYNEGKSFIKTMQFISNTVRGWGNTYSFCNDGELFKHMDGKIQEELDRYTGAFRGKYKKQSFQNKRRLLGVHLLNDNK